MYMHVRTDTRNLAHPTTYTITTDPATTVRYILAVVRRAHRKNN